MKRFYQEARAEAGEGGWRILLDGKPVKTPARADLRIASQALAEAVAAEWQSQGGEIVPMQMPLTQLAISALDLSALDHARIVGHLAGYAASELLCYREPQASPLRAAQASAWEQQLAEAEAHYGVRFTRIEGIMPTAQPPETLEQLREIVAGHGATELVALNVLVGAYGSLLLGLAVLERRLEGVAAWRLSRLESAHQEAKWGEDAEVAASNARILAEIHATTSFLSLLGEGGKDFI